MLENVWNVEVKYFYFIFCILCEKSYYYFKFQSKLFIHFEGNCIFFNFKQKNFFQKNIFEEELIIRNK